MGKIKPCPWCGHVAGVYTDGWEDNDRTLVYGHFVKCKNTRCHVKPCTVYFDTIDQAIEAWNRRAET